MSDLTRPVTAADFPGVDAATAATLAMQHEIMAGRAGSRDQRIELSVGMRDQPPPAKPFQPAPTVTPAQAVSALAEHEENRLQGHLETVYAPPARPNDYRVPPASGPVTDEAFAADRALTQMLHGERMPQDLGNALLQDLARARPAPPSEKRTEALAELRPWAERMLRVARANPTLRPYVEGASGEQLLAVLAPETVVALIPWVRFRATNRL